MNYPNFDAMQSKLEQAFLKEILDEQVFKFNRPNFIVNDPICIPHRYTNQQDIEVAGFLAATISWGKRAQILSTANRLLDKMGESPFDFVMHSRAKDQAKLHPFVYRTFNSADLIYFLKGLRHIYSKYQGPEFVFKQYAEAGNLQLGIHHFRKHFFELRHEVRTEKHLADPLSNSAAKRINMWLRWMVRNDNKGVDFGLWKSLSPSQLSCPLDVHSGNIAREFGLIQRKQNDAKAVSELDTALRKLDPLDPVKYDFALFGTGVNS